MSGQRMTIQSRGRRVLAVIGIIASASLAHGQGLLHRWDGTRYDGDFGAAIAGAGDVDDDGFPDTIVGDERPSPGSAVVFSGRDGSAIASFASGIASDSFGYSVDCAGDVDQDGFVDLIVGAESHREGNDLPGRAYVYSGADSSLLHQVQGGNISHLGRAVSGAGDSDADGFDDLLVGASGAAFVFSGRTGSELFELGSPGSGDGFGQYLDLAGDVNDDGSEDWIVSAFRDDTAGNRSGSVRVFSGLDGSLVHTIHGNAPGAELRFVSRVGDVDGDGRADLLTGQDDLALVHSGLDASIIHSIPRTGTWIPVAGVGDIDGDGRPEFMASSSVGSNSGVVDVFSGLDGSQLFSLTGEEPFYTLGETLGSVGDVNGDGAADLLVADRNAWNDASPSGSVFLFSGTCGTVRSYGTGCAGSGGFAPTLSVSSCASPGTGITIDIRDGWGSGMAWLIAGPSPTSLPLAGGCTLLVFPFAAVYPLPMSGTGPGNGSISISTVLPITMGLGTAYLQAVVTDAPHWRGFSLTNGISVEFR